MGKLSTKELMATLITNRDRVIEASLNDGVFNATHVLRYGGRKIFDCGIDSEVISWRPKDFLDFYPSAFWLIDQVV